MACIGMYIFWCELHILVYIDMYSQVICAGFDMYLSLLACLTRKKWYLLYVLVCKLMYLYVLLCIDLYWMYGI